MRHFVLTFIVLLLATACMTGCHKTAKAPVATKTEANTADADTTVYGVCGEGTSMHSLQIITDAGDTLEYAIADEGPDSTDVQGGLMAGDRLAVIGTTVDGERTALRVINTTTLLGHWTSIDKNFVIEEGGTIASEVKAETSPWTSWKIFNGHLLLNRDTFDVVSLGADSLYIENRKGIFVFKRQLQ